MLNFSLNKNTVTLAVVAIITLLFFVAGAFDVLDYVIIKILLFGLTIVITLGVTLFLFKKKRPEDKLQDDFN